MPLEARPKDPVPPDFAVPNSRTYKVKDGETWESIARDNGLSAEALIWSNFKTTDSREVNWYLRHYVGCQSTTGDGMNWRFSSSASPGTIRIPPQTINMPPMVIEAEAPSKLKNVWAGLAKAHSGDFFVIGAHDVTGKLYNLGDKGDNVRNVVINVNGFKFGPGLGASISVVFVIAHGYTNAAEMNGVSGDWDFDVALVAKLSDVIKGVRGLGKAVDTYEKYKKMRYLTENAIKNRNITKPGIYTLPIPFAGTGVHLWGGFKFGDVTVMKTGVGVP